MNQQKTIITIVQKLIKICYKHIFLHFIALYDKLQSVLVINMVSKIMLEIRKDRAEKRPEDKELAKEICDIVKLPFNEKEFSGMATRSLEGEEPGTCIDIFFENHYFIVEIYDEEYLVQRSHFNQELEFEAVYKYMHSEPFSKAVTVKHGDYGIVLINETNSNVIRLYNKEGNYVRGHGNYSIVKNGYDVGVKKFWDLIKFEGYSHSQEAYYDDNPNNTIHLSEITKEDEYVIITAAALNESYYKTIIDNNLTTTFVDFLSDFSDGIITKLEEPNISFIYTDLEDFDKSNSFLITKIYLSDKKMFVLLVSPAKNHEPIYLKCDSAPYITIRDLEILNTFMSNNLVEEPCFSHLIDYLNDLKFRLSLRQRNTFDSLVTFNGDALDYYIIEGKDTFSKGKPIEQRGFELYMDKEAIPEMFDKIDSRIKNSTTTFHQ